MSRAVHIQGDGDPVEAAVQAGKIAPERAPHYYKLMAKEPKKTARTLARLEPLLEPPGGDQRVQASVDRIPEPQPTEYPKEWLQARAPTGSAPTQASGEQQQVAAAPVRGNISFEEPAMQHQFGGIAG